LGNSNDILDKYATEFGDGIAEEQPVSTSSSSKQGLYLLLCMAVHSLRFDK
jgi:hypothetical protein